MIDREDNPDSPASEAPGAATAMKPDVTSADALLGVRLRAAREAKGMAIADCANALHLPIKVLERLEASDFGAPEHFVFLRGALQGYARFLGLPAGSCAQALRVAAPAKQPALISVARTSPMRWLLQRYGTAATSIVLTATIAVPLVLLGLRGGLQRPVARIVSLDQAPAVTLPTAKKTTTAMSAAAPSTSPDAAPFRASMTPFAAIGLAGSNETAMSAPASTAPASAPTPTPTPVAATGQHALTLSASADCWFEITGAGGNKIDSGMLHAGDSRTWHSAGPLHVTLGNADGVTVTRDGQLLALDAYRHANVARFDVFAPPAGSGEND